MTSSIALLVGAIVIFYLLRNEQRESKGVSRAAWIPTIWMLYYASKPIARWMDPQGEIDESGSAADRFFLLVLLCLALTVIARRGLDWRARLQGSGALMLLLFYMLLSCLWSEGPFASFKQWFRVLGSAIMPLVLLTEEDPRQALQSLFLRTIYILIPLSVVLIKYVPDLGVEYRAWNGEKFWVGACLQKNGLGRLCLICAVFLVWRFMVRSQGRNRPVWKHQTWIEIAILVLIGWLLKGPGGNYPVTAIAVIALCSMTLAGLLLLNRSSADRLFRGVTWSTVALVLALAFVSVSGMIPSIGVQAMGRDASFTGRTDIWNAVRSTAWQSPVLGVGYGGYWAKPHAFPNVGLVNEGHNGYLDVFVETGLIGLGLLLIVLGSFARKALAERSHNYDWACFRIVFLLMLVLHNFTETSLLRCSAHLWALFVYLFFIFPEGLNSAEESSRVLIETHESRAVGAL